MAAQYILATVAAAFLVLASARVIAGAPYAHPQVRAWLLTAVILAAVSTWLFVR